MNTTSTDPGSKSAAEIEREVQESRADLEQTLDAIQERLSPGQLVDQALGYFRGGRGVDFARNLGDSIAANPIPLALMGAGLAWMMMSGQRSASGYRERSTYWDDQEGPAYWDEDIDSVEGHYGGFAEEDMAYLGPEAETGGGFGAETGGGFGEAVKEAGRDAKERIGEVGDRARDAAAQARSAASQARDRVREAGAHARDRAREAGADARDRFGRARAGITGRAHEARARAGYYGRRARRGVLRSFEEQPLVLGAIGLAIGAALGAALPPTETEDELMGETRDEALRRATRAGREQAHKVREAAGAVAAAAREEASKQGLTREGAGETGQATSVPKSSGETGEAASAPKSSGQTGETASTGSVGTPEPRDESRPAGFAGATQPVTDPKAGLDRP